MKNSKTTFTILIVIVLLASALLRLWNITGPDIATDDALYSFRSIGYFDYVASENFQSTPITWFAEQQWWQKLSFHDAPPLVFAVQWFFFKIGGDSALFARLPFVIAGTLSVLMLYALGTLMRNRLAGFVSAIALATMSYHIWISRIGYLEAFIILWSLLALYFFVRARERPMHYIWWAIFLAAGILTKYTFIFMFPVFIVPLLWWRRKYVWKQKWFYASIALFFILISPVIIYNIKVFQTRGHFDAAISSIVGTETNDFKILAGRNIGGQETKFLGISKAIDVTRTIKNNMSDGFQLLSLFSLATFVFLTARKRREGDSIYQKENYYLLWSGLIWALAIVSLAGGSDRFSVILLPFIALMMGYAISWLWGKIQKKQKILLVIATSMLIIWEAFFAMQNQLMPKPIVDNNLLHGGVRPVWEGYNQLESYVKKFYNQFPDFSYIIFAKTPQIINYQIGIVESWFEKGIDGNQQTHLLVYDDRMEWFPAIWTFERRRLYDVTTLPSLTQFLDAVEENGAHHFTQYGFEDVTFVMFTDEEKTTDLAKHEIRQQKFADILSSTNEPIDIITNPSGEEVFKIYRLPLNSPLWNQL